MKKGHVSEFGYTWPLLIDGSSTGMSGLSYQGMLTAGVADVEAIATSLHAEASQHLITILYTTRVNHELMICGYPEAYKVVSNHARRLGSSAVQTISILIGRLPRGWIDSGNCETCPF